MRKQRSKLIKLDVLESGSLYAEPNTASDDSRIGLGPFLRGEVQTSSAIARFLLTGIEMIKGGRVEEWEGPGNILSLLIKKDGAVLAEYNFPDMTEEELLTPEHYSLEELRDALEDWLDLIAEVYPQEAEGSESWYAEMVAEEVERQQSRQKT